jgi:hypothetical protein
VNRPHQHVVRVPGLKRDACPEPRRPDWVHDPPRPRLDPITPLQQPQRELGVLTKRARETLIEAGKLLER